LVPVYLANLAGPSSLSPDAKRRPIFLHSLSFVAGFSLLFIGLGTSVGLLGAAFPTDLLSTIGGAILVAFGVFILAATRIPRLNYEVRLHRSFGEGTGYFRSLVVGGAFALGWTPCVGPVLGGILTLASTSQTAWKGAYLLTVYSLGLGIPFIAVGLAMGTALPVIRWIRGHSRIIAPISGILFITVGILMLTDTLVDLYINL
jgi:cytochrome c-type biogenesis protein